MHKLTPLLLVLLAVSCGPAESDQKGAEIVAAAKTATGGNAWDAIHIWHETGHALLPSGEATQYEHWADLQSLKTRNRNVRKSGLHFSIFDGQAAYQSTNSNFEPRSELDANMMRGGAYIACFGFFFPNRFPASFRFDGTRIDHGIPYDVVKVSPAGLDAMDLWVDQQSHRIFRVADAQGRFRVDFSDYRAVGTVTLPFMSMSDGDTVETDSIVFEPAGSTSFSLAPEQ
jgi:hypothetical protein